MWVEGEDREQPCIGMIDVYRFRNGCERKGVEQAVGMTGDGVGYGFEGKGAKQGIRF